jgi:hypothetical protein
MTQSHTPWFYGEGINPDLFVIYDKNNKRIAAVDLKSEDAAKTIVKCVNAHDDLVLQLETAVAFIDRLLLVGAWDRQVAQDISIKSETVLTKAGAA